MVAGWDGLLPAWFSQLHPRFRTPVRSLALTVAACVVLGAASLLQVGEQEANQILVGAGMACCGMYYLTMFAVVWRERAPWWLRLAVVAAGGVTALAVALDVVPVVDVARPVLFGIKVGGAVALINAAGVYVYRRAA
jgi:amino acid transporter